MSRFSFEDSEKYGAGKNNYFNLKDDKDTAVVRFLYNDINDVEGVATHEVQVGDRSIDVECLRNYDEPLEKCPFCNAGMKQSAKMFIPVYDEGSKESKIWTRGKKFFNQISSLCNRIRPLVGTPVEIERCGKAGAKDTSYALYPLTERTDNKLISDFPEIKPEGICFQQKTAEEMNYYLQNGRFPEEVTTRNNNSNQDYAHRQESREVPIRRRPVTRGSEDEF